MRRSLLFVTIIGTVVAACTATGGTTTISAEVTSGVITIEDSTGTLVAAEWLDPSTPALNHISSDSPPAVVMDSSEPASIHIAVLGNTCLPQINLDIDSRNPLTISVRIREGVPPNNAQCGNLLTSHEFAVEITPPVNPDEVTLTVTSIPPD